MTWENAGTPVLEDNVRGGFLQSPDVLNLSQQNYGNLIYDPKGWNSNSIV